MNQKSLDRFPRVLSAEYRVADGQTVLPVF